MSDHFHMPFLYKDNEWQIMNLTVPGKLPAMRF